MRLPRRTPYYAAATDELTYVHSHLYGDRSDAKGVDAALGVVRLWMHRGACPQAVESTALLVESIRLDQAHAPTYGVRATYAMALTRFVNSVADSFQTGMYAQSIGAIAERIGLPQWLVQVRHSATHEELPSLEVCRDASAIALGWLDQHYWQPTLHTSLETDGDGGTHDGATADEAEQAWHTAACDRAAQLLLTYRNCAQAVRRDVSLAQRSSPPHEKALADVVAWLHDEAGRYAQLAVRFDTAERLSVGAMHADLEEAEDDMPAAVLPVVTLLITQLLVPGALFPADTKKRQSVGSVSLDDWAPLWDALLDRLQAEVPFFFPMLVDALIASPTYQSVAHAWVAWLAAREMTVPLGVPRWREGEDTVLTTFSSRGAQRVPLRRLVVQYALEADSEDWHVLAQSLSASDPVLKERVAQLCALRHVDEVTTMAPDACLAEMEARASTSSQPSLPGVTAMATEKEEEEAAAPGGWHRASAYVPTPIGCLAGERPSLLC